MNEITKTVAATARRGIVGVGLACASLFAQALPVDLAAPSISLFSTAIGDSRSVVVRAYQDFSLKSLGVIMNPLVLSFDMTAEVFAFDETTNTRGAMLATATQSFNSGLLSYDVNVLANLTAGSFYELNLSPFGFDQFFMEFYEFNGPQGGGVDAPYAAGPVTVFDGCGDGNVLGCNNTVLAHFRLDVDTISAVPEPATLPLVGLALLAGICAVRRRKD